MLRRREAYRAAPIEVPTAQRSGRRTTTLLDLCHVAHGRRGGFLRVLPRRERPCTPLRTSPTNRAAGPPPRTTVMVGRPSCKELGKFGNRPSDLHSVRGLCRRTWVRRNVDPLYSARFESIGVFLKSAVRPALGSGKRTRQPRSRPRRSGREHRRGADHHPRPASRHETRGARARPSPPDRADAEAAAVPPPHREEDEQTCAVRGQAESGQDDQVRRKAIAVNAATTIASLLRSSGWRGR